MLIPSTIHRNTTLFTLRSVYQCCLLRIHSSSRNCSINCGHQGGETSMVEISFQLKDLIRLDRLSEARHLFDEMPHRDEITWTNMISGYVNSQDALEALRLFVKLRLDEALCVEPFVLSVVLKACGITCSSLFGEALHGYSIKINLSASVFVGSAIVDMYMKAGMVDRGCRVFQEMPVRNVVCWTAVITGLVNYGLHCHALVHFSEMLRSGINYDTYVLPIVLKACALSNDIDRGREIHCHTIKKGIDDSSFVANSLAAMYNKCGNLNYVLRVFEMMSVCDVVSWTQLVNAYGQSGYPEKAVETFVRMRGRGVSPNGFTFASVFSSCACLGRIGWGEQLHGHVVRLGIVEDISVTNSIMHFYASCGNMKLASLVFQKLMKRNIISWSTIIAGYSKESSGVEAFYFFLLMRREGARPNAYPISSLLSACGNNANVEPGKQLHALAICSGLHQIGLVRSSLISLYAKCGSISQALKVFNEAKYNNIVSWTAIIKGYAEHGYYKEAIDLFDKLPQVGLKPDSVTFIGILTACSHAGLVDLGLHHFNSMHKYGIRPSQEHYGCLIDLLCRVGRLKDAELMIESMPFEANDVVWSILLRACMVYGDIERGIGAAENVLNLVADCKWTLITLASMFASVGRWKEAANVRKRIRSIPLDKEQGWSWIKVKDKIFTFSSGNSPYSRIDILHRLLTSMTKEPKSSIDDNLLTL